MSSKVAKRAPRTCHESLRRITFNHRELNQILGVYARKVADGEWRDYAIDMLNERAVFSIFRRSSEFPLYRIEKNPKNARKQGAYSVIAPSGLILKRGHDLGHVLRVLERQLRLVES
ncbi:MAG: DUF2794 domain-containing protein [Hyphomicrobiaceae bacterium]